MPLGLARDSMLDLAEMARKVDDGEFKASIEYDEENGENNMITVSIIDDSIDNDITSDHGDRSEDQSTDSVLNPERNETKVGDPDASIASSTRSIDAERAVVAAPQGAPPTTPLTPNSVASSQNSSYGRYSGFETDYAYYENYGNDYTSYSGGGNIAPSLIGGNKKQKGFWCCFFPWAASNDIEDDDGMEESGKETLVSVGRNSGTTSKTLTKDDDEVSTGSDMFGEKLSEKETKAVLARLRLAQPDTAQPSSPDETDETKPKVKGLLNGIHMPPEGESTSEEGGLKGILKRPSKLSKNNLMSMTHPGKGDAGGRRRSLFPAYSETSKEKKDLNLMFSTMARVLTVKSHKEMGLDEKGEIWWQKSDYEEFRKTGRLITKAMLEGGSEIWLATNRSWQLPNQARSTSLKLATSLAAKNKGDANAKKVYEETRDKWWHKFGHSRRGLEHMASIDEGRQRQANVRHAIRAVVEENRRQRAFLREDPDKLRIVSIQHTSWARDLALAAGASDADAVSTNFCDNSRKSREFYLLKFSRTKQNNASKSPSHRSETVPAFMRPARSLTVKPNILDVNTSSQIRYRHAQRKSARVAPIPTSSSSSSVKNPSQVMAKEETEATAGGKSMAKKAAGFASGEEVANMSAILTGMGPLPKSPTAATVGGP